ncbi:follistatin-related protein 5-like [Artemia franciscana]|uniref:follistatin-related protein 5-like n=1 Tax=Artemia franciscana TaxID=6661 RepID=UPI0032DBDE38
MSRSVVVILLAAMAIIFQVTDGSSSDRHHRDATYETVPPWPFPNHPRYSVQRGGALPWSLDQNSPENPCDSVSCPRGRECAVTDTGATECICLQKCPKKHHLVCGTDGVLYSSHCELHRKACLMDKAVGVDNSFRCLMPPVYKQFEESLKYEDTKETQTTPFSSNKPDISYYPSSENPFAISSLESTVMTTQQDITDAVTTTPVYCTQQEYEIMKDNLLLLNHARLGTNNNGGEGSHGRDLLVSLMFSHFDENNSGLLEAEELKRVGAREQLSRLSHRCSLVDLLRYEDSDGNNRLDINEFYAAFSKLYSVSVVTLEKSLEINHITARVRDNVQIRCDITGSPAPPIVWRRHGVDLSTLGDEDIRVFSDGSLYLMKLQLHHSGNYTCQAQRNHEVVQTHVVSVHTLPQVRVTPRLQSKKPGDEAKLECHATGEPFPKVEWLKNDAPIALSRLDDKYSIRGESSVLKISQINYADTGAYMCQASGLAGVSRDISSLVVREDAVSDGIQEEKRFYVFHEKGVSVYDPNNCRLHHQIQGTDIVPGTQDYVCGEKGVVCNWGRAIAVSTRYIYVTQPKKDRALVISKEQMVVVDVVATDRYPVELSYIPSLDQVWISCWRSEDDHGARTLQVIRDASQKKSHHTVHPEPIDGQFDLVKDFFPPSIQEFGDQFRFGYVSHVNQRGLYKMNLQAMRYVKAVDLAPYNCVPRTVQYSSLYGLVIMECEEPVTRRPTGQIVLDYLTDIVLTHKASLHGTPNMSPDSRHLVTVQHDLHGVTILVQETTPTGLRFSFDVKTSLNISDVTFHPSSNGHGFDLFATAADKDDLLYLNLVSGKVDIVTGLGEAMDPVEVQWGSPNRPITSAGVFGTYLVSPAKGAVFVINGETRTVNCEIGNLSKPLLNVWLY